MGMRSLRWKKYNDEAALVQNMTEANGVILVVVDGYKGHGVSCILDPRRRAQAAQLLREMAADLEADLRGER